MLEGDGPRVAPRAGTWEEGVCHVMDDNYQSEMQIYCTLSYRKGGNVLSCGNSWGTAEGIGFMLPIQLTDTYSPPDSEAQMRNELSTEAL